MIRRAAIYARCSTEEVSQKDALKKQVDEGRACVRENGWVLADIYVESRSGTTRFLWALLIFLLNSRLYSSARIALIPVIRAPSVV
mgnify:CR=1 FL=1